ncbi:protein NRT1/ PTR FAMILY 5.2-like [Senna tora]|uniref:Protein NRT1/ PTR FAMILY 5.2-like n=1 Tax=Senna tora TaxID=362788 RepID=A0A834SJ89_9FABA|nr:protein NRT1/ PTR FAMILY 5.2-like [Senna tora]
MNIMAMVEEKGDQDYTEDGSVDLKGRPVLRSKTGGWKACSFIVGYEVFERMAYYGISTNLVLYLTTKLHEGTVESSNNVTNWVGSVWMMPVTGAYIADAYFGRYWTFVSASVIYLLGMCLLTLTVSLAALRPPECGEGVKDEDCPQASSLQVGIFFCALYIIAIGTGGTKPNISTMGADQFDDFEPKEKAYKLSFFNWWMFSIFFGTLFSNTFLIYIQDNVGWSLGYGLPTAGLAVSVLVFLVGTPYYRHKLPSGSPLNKIVQVLVASVRKWKVQVPHDPNKLYELSMEEYTNIGRYRIDHTCSLRFLDKAAIKTDETSPWMLCPVTQVEETKQMMKMLPILVATLIPSMVIAQVGTLFIKQGTTLNRSMGPHFDIPPASLAAFVTIFMLISIVIYDRYFVPAIRRYTKNPRGITMLQRLGIGLVLHVMIMVIASFTERKRLSFAREKKLLGKKDIIPLTIFILLPQFALGGVADAFVEVAKLEFFYDQAPESMKSLGTSYFTTSLGIGHFLSSFVLSTVADVTKRHGHVGWIQDNLNVSHLDYYYAFLAILSFINLLFFLLVAKLFEYNVDAKETKTELEMEYSPKKDSSQEKTGISQLTTHNQIQPSHSPSPDYMSSSTLSPTSWPSTPIESSPSAREIPKLVPSTALLTRGSSDFSEFSPTPPTEYARHNNSSCFASSFSDSVFSGACFASSSFSEELESCPREKSPAACADWSSGGKFVFSIFSSFWIVSVAAFMAHPSLSKSLKKKSENTVRT